METTIFQLEIFHVKTMFWNQRYSDRKGGRGGCCMHVFLVELFFNSIFHEVVSCMRKQATMNCSNVQLDVNQVMWTKV